MGKTVWVMESTREQLSEILSQFCSTIADEWMQDEIAKHNKEAMEFLLQGYETLKTWQLRVDLDFHISEFNRSSIRDLMGDCLNVFAVSSWGLSIMAD